MRAVFLCAGYGTRLYPLTKDKPKALLTIAGEPLLNHLIRKVEAVALIERVILVTNERFASHFSDWSRSLKTKLKVSVLNDHTTAPENRLGAIRDLKLALDQDQKEEDVLVVASDNLFDADLASFISFARSKAPACSVGVFDVQDRVLAKKYGLIKMDSSGKIMDFFEKPAEPPTTLASMGVYYFSRESLAHLDEYLKTNQNPDAPGYYMAWLSKRTPLYAFQFSGTWFDIGDLDSYEKADRYFTHIHESEGQQRRRNA